MRLLIKREIMKTIDTMQDMYEVVEERWHIEDKNVLFEWLVQLQEAGMEIGKTVEEQKESYVSLVNSLEEYCEAVYQLGQAATGGDDADRWR